MEKYLVQSGDIKDHIVMAQSHKMAMIKAIEEVDPHALGLLISAIKDGDAECDTVFMKTESVLTNMGFLKH